MQDKELKKFVEEVAQRVSKETAEQTAKHTVRQTMLSLGINPDHPQHAQANFIFLSKLRKSSEDSVMWIRRSAIGTVWAAFFALIVLGVENWRNGG